MEEKKELLVPDINMPYHVKAMEEEKELPNLQPFDSLSSQWKKRTHLGTNTNIETLAMEEEKELPVPDLNMPYHVKAMEEEKELPNLQPFDSLSSQSTTWTDEKHNAYLASLEASFVKQLHHSLSLLPERSEQKSYDPSPSQQQPLTGSHSSDKCTAWTNQKHNAYIASLEASFVKQLHRSLGLLSSHSEQSSYDPSPSQQLPLSGTHSCDQNRQ
ncbi:hypothetical protein Vadar_021895 [Vaccinium darrowii]|uniref:Uncharacterized protein n=1 Tax=Vaccinium darrowii TaxID=229202 RepID=A0ACB7XJ51_9ERIC|nr:hypothetical protein Vadar_021895 [Vaccinium darrowii]